MIPDPRYPFHKIFNSPGLVLTAITAIAMGTITMGRADPHMRQELLNLKLAIKVIDYVRLQAQQQDRSMSKSSAVQVDADNGQDQAGAQIDNGPYSPGATARFGNPQSRNVASRFSEQHQPAASDLPSENIPGQIVPVDRSPWNTHWIRTIKVELDGALPPGIPQMSISGPVDLKRLLDAEYTGARLLANQNSTLNSFKVDADGKPARRISFKAGRAFASKSQVPHFIDFKTVDKHMVKEKKVVEAER